MKREKTARQKKFGLFFRCLFLMIIVVGVCDFFFITPVAYGKRLISIPFVTDIKLIRYLLHSNNYDLMMKYIDVIGLGHIVPVAFCVYVFLLLHSKDSSKLNKDELATKDGSARWSEERELKEMSLLHSWNKLPPVIFGQSFDAKFDNSDPDKMKMKTLGSNVVGYNIQKNNTMTIGGQGSNKGAGTILPTLLNYPHSVVVYDPAKENFRKSAGYRQTLGKVLYFDPSDTNSTLHFNPFDWIEKNSGAARDIGNIASIIVPRSQGNQNDFWDNSARNLLTIYMSYVFLFSKEKSLRSVASIARNVNENKDKFYYKNMIKRIEEIENILQEEKCTEQETKNLVMERESLEKILLQLTPEQKKKQDKKNEECEEDTGMVAILQTMDNDIKYKLKMEKKSLASWEKDLLTATSSNIETLKIVSGAEQTISSVVAMLDSYMQVFNENNVASLMQDTTFKPDELQLNEKPVSLYLCIQTSDTERMLPFVRLFLSCLSNRLCDTDAKPYKHNLLFVLDEFTELGYMETVYKKMSYARKFHINYMIICQSLKQLEDEKCYGKTKTSAILANTFILDVKQVSDLDTAKFISERLGKKTVKFDTKSHNTSTKITSVNEGGSASEHYQGREMMQANEIMEMPCDEEILIIAGKHPARVKKFRYFEYSILNQRSQIPYVQPESQQLKDNRSPQQIEDDILGNSAVSAVLKSHNNFVFNEEEINTDDNETEENENAVTDTDKNNSNQKKQIRKKKQPTVKNKKSSSPKDLTKKQQLERASENDDVDDVSLDEMM